MYILEYACTSALSQKFSAGPPHWIDNRIVHMLFHDVGQHVSCKTCCVAVGIIPGTCVLSWSEVDCRTWTVQEFNSGKYSIFVLLHTAYLPVSATSCVIIPDADACCHRLGHSVMCYNRTFDCRHSSTHAKRKLRTWEYAWLSPRLHPPPSYN